MNSESTNKRWFSYNPTTDTVVAIVTALLMTCGGYYLLVHLPEGSPLQLIYHVIFELLPVIFPVWWLCYYKKESFKELGITREGIVPSLAISGVLTLIFIFFVLRHFSSYGPALVPHLLTNAIILWEPFFLFAWLQLRFDRAFGILPGILLTGICLGAYHIGTYQLPMVLTLAAFGIIFAALYRITSNLLIMWPLTWSAASAEGTLQGGALFGWNDVLFALLILAIQLAFMVYTWKKFHNASENH
jgi:membrane protease YdiL (CAAX protease family)